MFKVSDTSHFYNPWNPHITSGLKSSGGLKIERRRLMGSYEEIWLIFFMSPYNALKNVLMAFQSLPEPATLLKKRLYH